MHLLVFSGHYPPHTGGLETHAAEFNKYLSQKDQVASITVYTAKSPKEAPDREQVNDKLDIIRFPSFEVIPNFPFPCLWRWSFWQSWSAIWRLEPDIVISRTRFFITSPMALVYAKLKRCKWVHIEHGSDFVQLSSQWKSAVARWYDFTFGRLIFRSSDVTVSISQAVQAFVAQFDSRPSPIIRRGVEVDQIEAVAVDKKLRKQYADKVIITFIGRLIDGKGVLDLLHAIHTLDFKNTVCFIVGDGPQRKVLEKEVAKLGLADQVVFWNQQPALRAWQLLKTSDILVNPSYTEGLPTSVIEASLCSKAIVATNVGGTPEIINSGKTGFLIEPRDSTLLGQKLELLITNEPLRQKFGQAAYREARAKFTWPKTIDRYCDLFHMLV